MAEAPRHPETRDVWPRALLLFGGGLLAFLIIAVIGLGLIFGTGSYWPLPGASSRSNATSPALQTRPETDLASFRKAEEEHLHKLGWVDRAAGIARIPIEDAMQIVASQGLPAWAEKAPSAGEDCVLLTNQVPRAPQAKRCKASPAKGVPPK